VAVSRRDVLRWGGAAALALPFVELVAGRRRAEAAGGTARRLIVFYFPDGVLGPSQDGEPSLWHPSGGETSFVLPAALAALEPYRASCTFFRGLTMGPADQGSHPGGAKKLLTAFDGGGGISIDQRLAGSVGANDPFRSLYLGVQATQNGASGDKHLSYAAPGVTVPPEDDPAAAFGRIFGARSRALAAADPRLARRATVIDGAASELEALRGALGAVDRTKLDLHLEALREVERRVVGDGDGGGDGGDGGGGGGGGGATCEAPTVDRVPDRLAAESVPRLVRAQIDLMVQAMACGRSRVGVIQCSHHTSEMIMSRFMGTPMFDPAFDMRSHQASHYGPRHDLAKREVRDYLAQRTWWVEQFAYLLSALAARPEGDGSMLDQSLVVLCTEVNDGNTHGHDDMPFVLAGGGGGALRSGRLLSFPSRRHADLWIAIAHAMGDPIGRFGDVSSGPLPGLLA
jgi:hypothetical protein